MARIFASLSFICALTASLASGALIGVDSTTGLLYSVSEVDASLSVIGDTGVYDSWADIAFAPNGTLYGFTDSAATPTLYTINPQTAVATVVGPLNVGFVFEGGLAISSAGIAFGMGTGSNGNAGLFRIDLTTGSATVLGTVGGVTDINGLIFREDGNLIGLDDSTNSLRVINPMTLTSSFLASIPTSVGGLGGVTEESRIGYYVTAGPFANGSNNLYAFDLSNGTSTLIGNLDLTDDGISGLASASSPTQTPEQPTFFLCASCIALIFSFVRYIDTSTKDLNIPGVNSSQLPCQRSIERAHN